MNEVSIILKNNVSLTTEEFRILDRYSHTGKIWTLTFRHKQPPYIVRYKSIEYIFDPESLTVFRIFSDNILVTWQTEITKNLGPNDEYHLVDSIFISPYRNIK